MGNFEFIETQDGSLGLYNNQINDIYHAKEGAYTEALDKFVYPSLNFIKQMPLLDTLKVCDICYGLGYNTVAFIENLLKSNLLNKFNKIEINLLEYDRELIILSPFIKNDKMNYSLRLFMLKSIKKAINKSEIEEILNKYRPFTNTTIYKRFKGKLKYTARISYNRKYKQLFLHNTYYNYISTRFKKALKVEELKRFTFKIHANDARKSIFNVSDNQNIVFLDAFDPKKLPTLWSKEFFDAIYSKSDDNFMLFTYSHSACVRSAMKDAKFYIGDNNGNGTVASKKEKYISNKLSEYNLGLLNTNAGIPYRDYNLNCTKDELIQERLRHIKCDGRESSTHYAKTHQK